ncbi:MAG: tetratricopeptide repeat protein [Alistipes sp.]|nr:tetratricopeptide repeat protein [Alistipes sp.]
MKRMNVTTGLLSLILMAGATAVMAAEDGSPKGVDYYKVKMYPDAKRALINELQDEKSNKAEVNFYLGEIYFDQHKSDSASYYYQQGLAADPAYVLNAIGNLKVNLKNNPDAEKAFSGLLTGKNKKNPAIYVAIARAYMPVSKPKAQQYLELAKSVGPKSPEVYVLEGDMFAAEHKAGEAANSYEQATYFDPGCKEAYFKYAELYSKANPQYAIDMLNKLITLDPGYKIAYVELADIYYENERYAEAVDAYSKYISTETSSVEELARYAALLYLSKRYDEAKELVQKVTVRAPESAALKRINMYLAYDQGDFNKALELGTKMRTEIDSSRWVVRDYVCMARSYAKTDKTKEAIAEYQKALAMDSMRIDLLNELEVEYKKERNYVGAIEVSQDAMERDGIPDKPSEFLNLGKNYYMAASSLRPADDSLRMNPQDSMKMVTYLKSADSLFAKVTETLADHYAGHFWRARVHSSLDPESTQGLAKPYYEMTAALLEKDPKKDSRLLIECYSYLGYYYYLKQDNENSKIYWKKILALDPNHAIAKSVMEVLEPQK